MIVSLAEVFVFEASDDGMGKVLPFRRPLSKDLGVSKVPLSQVFRGKPPPRLTAPSYEKERYSWGELRRILIGSSYTVMVHPEDWWKIEHLTSGKTYEFKSEDGRKWKVHRGNDGRSFALFTDGNMAAGGDWGEMLGELK